jgi:tetratricopeptide (TPR) repeat protein
MRYIVEVFLFLPTVFLVLDVRKVLSAFGAMFVFSQQSETIFFHKLFLDKHMMKKISLFLLAFWLCQWAWAQNADASFQEAQDFFEKQQWAEALVSIEPSIEQNPNNPTAYILRGTCEYYLGNIYGASINWYKAKDLGADVAQIIKTYVPDDYDNSRSTQEYIEDGNHKFQGNDYEGAAIDYTNAIYKDPKHAWAYNKRAYAKARINRYREAVADYDKALAIDPSEYRIYTFRGMAKYNLGDKAGACEDVKQGVAKGHSKFEALLKTFGCK